MASLMKIEAGKVRYATEAEEVASYATHPGQFAKRLAREFGSGRDFGKVRGYLVDAVLHNVAVVDVIRVESADGCSYGSDYAYLADGRKVATFYLFPHKGHKRPSLHTVTDEYGECQQWIAPWVRRSANHPKL